jgi:hypothetical protein
MSRRTASTKGAAKAAPASMTLYRVTFEDVTTWQAFIKAPDADTAKNIAEDCWNEAGTEGFKDEYRLDVVSEGCTTGDYQAEEVPL